MDYAALAGEKQDSLDIWLASQHAYVQYCAVSRAAIARINSQRPVDENLRWAESTPDMTLQEMWTSASGESWMVSAFLAIRVQDDCADCSLHALVLLKGPLGMLLEHLTTLMCCAQTPRQPTFASVPDWCAVASDVGSPTRSHEKSGFCLRGVLCIGNTIVFGWVSEGRDESVEPEVFSLAARATAAKVEQFVVRLLTPVLGFSRAHRQFMQLQTLCSDGSPVRRGHADVARVPMFHPDQI